MNFFMFTGVKEKTCRTRGFTIIELLVVLAIFALLMAIVFANFRESRISSRNAKRLQDVREIQNALALYHSTNRNYPGAVGTNGAIQTELPGLVSGGFMPALPEDPSGTGTPYYYCPGNDFGGPQDYILRATLELEKGSNPAALSGDLDGTVYGCDCSDANLYYCVGP